MTTLQEGQQAPEFQALDEEGRPISLSDFRGRKLVLYFYPADNTPTCTTEACNLRDNYDVFREAGYEIVGVSPDSARKHQGFIRKNSLPFRLIADEDLSVTKAYGAWGMKKMYGKEYEGLLRTTFVIDEAGVIRKVITKVDARQHAAQILEG
ncbi:MAG: hypothetical protein RLY31_2162 [Bacteroidota bacterium]|jgi:peroxiredoxin Q/BCP